MIEENNMKYNKNTKITNESDISNGSAPDRNLRNYLIRYTRKSYHGLFKDLEISRNQFLTLYLILLSFSSVLIISLFLNFNITQIRQNHDFGFYIIMGIILGFNVGGFLLDKIRGKRYPVLLIFIFFSILITSFHILFFRKTGEIVPAILFIGNSFVAGILYMFFIIFFIDFTTIIERGRIFSFLIILISASIGLFLLLIITDIFLLFPVILMIIALLFLYKNREQEEPYKPIKKEGTKGDINHNIVSYIIILGFFGLVIGLIIPLEEPLIKMSKLTHIHIIIMIFFTVIISLITTIVVGIIFDFSGRKASISYIIFAISIVNFLKIFKVNIEFFYLIIILAASLASFMSLPLLMSGITPREIFGRIIGLTNTIMLLFVFLGISLQMIILNVFKYQYAGNILLIGIINFASIISLFFLVNTKEVITSKERNWVNNLIHIYVIHESGLLLYDKSFIDEQSDSVEPDLASGGFIGLITMLKEITKEKQLLRTIDHGGKKIIFGFNSNKSIIIALLITEELIILRNKLSYFIYDIEKNYPIIRDNFSGVNSNLWRDRIKPILEKHFKQELSEIMPKTISNQKLK